jgi:DNA polymerase I-like protein with 3'-5' exonuclease and polymerase domains
MGQLLLRSHAYPTLKDPATRPALWPQSEGLLELLACIEMPLARVLADVEVTGIAASPERLAAQT